jgi:hypothetical protein
MLARRALVEVGEERFGRQRAEVSSFSRGNGVQKPQLLGQDFRGVFFLVVQCSVEGVKFFVEFF